MLNKGDTCYVRRNCKIQKATYLRKSEITNQCHWITLKGSRDVLVSRFVCMSGMRKEYVEAIK